MWHKILCICPGTLHSNLQSRKTNSTKPMFYLAIKVSMNKFHCLVALSCNCNFKNNAYGYLIFRRTVGLCMTPTIRKCPRVGKQNKFQRNRLSRSYFNRYILHCLKEKHLKRCSNSYIISVMEIKTTMRGHFTWVRIATIETSTNSKCLRGCRKKATLLCCCWDLTW